MTGIPALVISTLDYGESDRIVRLLTPNGKLEAFAHGARRSKRRFAGALDTLQTIRVELAQRSAHTRLVTLRSAVVERPRLGLRSELERIALGAYCAELCYAVASADEETGVYDQLTELLNRLESGPATTAMRRVFELRLLPVLGYAPDLSGCVVCGASDAPAQVDFARGGRQCRRHAGPGPLVGPRTLQWAEDVLAGMQIEGAGGLDEEGMRRAVNGLSKPLDAFWEQLLERRPKSLSLLNQLGL